MCCVGGAVHALAVVAPQCYISCGGYAERPLPQLASTPLPGRSPLLRKRGRLEHIPEGGQLDPSAASGLVPLYGASLPAELPAIASCPDPILDSLAVMENQAALSSADGLQGPTHMMQPLSAPCGQPPLSGPRGQHSSASNLLNMTGVGPGVQNSVWAAPEPATAGISQQGVSSRTGCNPVALAAAAKQAAVVLEQHLQRREQHLAACAQRRAKHKQR